LTAYLTALPEAWQGAIDNAPGLGVTVGAEKFGTIITKLLDLWDEDD
jgi:hypothetical protein